MAWITAMWLCFAATAFRQVRMGGGAPAVVPWDRGAVASGPRGPCGGSPLLRASAAAAGSTAGSASGTRSGASCSPSSSEVLSSPPERALQQLDTS